MCVEEILGCFRPLTLIMVVLFTIGGYAQLENIPIGEDVNIDRLYVGLLANTNLYEGNSSTGSNSRFQTGVRTSLWLIPKQMRVRAFGAFILKEDGATNYIKSYEAIFLPSKSTEISLGVMATPTTELRPNPITWQSQVETNAESTIPGGKPGIKIGHRFDKNLKLTYGLHDHNGSVVPHIKVEYKKIKASSFFKDGNLFLAVKWNYKNSDYVITKFEKHTAFSAIVLVSERYKLYSDVQFNGALRKLTFGEWGIRKHFDDNKLLSGFFSISYNSNMKQLQGGLFIHI